MYPQEQSSTVGHSASLTIPELEQSKTAVLNTLASEHSRRSYAYAIERFITWYCSEPRLTFNRTVVVRYRSFLERLTLSAATINLHLSAIRRLADESAESGWLSPELAIGIRRVKGVKRLGRKSGNWLTRNQEQELGDLQLQTRCSRFYYVIGVMPTSCDNAFQCRGCGCRLPRRMSDAYRIDTPIAEAIWESVTLNSLGSIWFL